MPRSVLITTSVLVILAGIAGFWLGGRQATWDATGVIEAVAARHVQEHGGDVTSCLGWLDEGGHGFDVKCGDIVYNVDRFGRVSVAAEDDI